MIALTLKQVRKWNQGGGESGGFPIHLLPPPEAPLPFMLTPGKPLSSAEDGCEERGVDWVEKPRLSEGELKAGNYPRRVPGGAETGLCVPSTW